MASILRSGSFLRIFSGFKHSLSSSYSRYEVSRIQKLQTPHLNLSIARSFAAQKPLENVATGQSPAPSLDKVLYRIDGEIRRTGRISKRDIEDIFGELKDLKYASSTQSLLLIRCCGSLVPEELPEVRNKLVQEIWDTLLKFNIPLDISHFNALLKVYLENEHKFSPTEFLSTLEQSGIEPNRVTYQRLISRYCHEGDIDGASKILEYMKEKQLPVNENVFNALIMGHARANDLESAHGVLGVMQGAGLEPSPETYMMLMVGYAEKGDIDGLNSVMKECEAAEVNLHNREYSEIILALAAKGHSEHVPQFIEKLEKMYGYQQDSMNMIYRLLNVGCDEVAYQIFQTMTVPQNAEGESAPVGTFFIKQLIKSGMFSVATIIQYCQTLKGEGFNMYALERALQFALTLERPELALAISRVMLEDGAPVRSHYFWPVIMHYASRGEKEMLYNTVKEMLAMEIPLTLETCKDYIMPALLDKGQDEEPVIVALKECGMHVPAIINGSIGHYINENDLVAAAQLLSRYRVKVTNLMRRDLAEAYVKTKEALAAVAVLGQMIHDGQKKEEDAGEEIPDSEETPARETGPARSTQDVGGMFLMDVLMISRASNAVPYLVPLLEAMKNRGISISNDSSAAVQSRLGEHLTEEIIELLSGLSSGDLTLQPLMRDAKPLSQQSIDELEQRLTELEIKNQPRTFVLSQLLTNYARMKNIEKAEEAKQKLESLEFPFTAGHYALLIEMYAIEGQLEKAVSFYEEFKSREPDSKLNPFKVLRLATAMISKGQLEEAVKLLQENAPTSNEEREDPSLNFISARLLNAALEQGHVTQVQHLFDILVEQNYAKPMAAMCGPLVRIHLANDNLVDALEAFEKICKEHRVTPLKHELTLACIKIEDTEKLQKIMDLSIDIHGEMNSLYDLVFAFIECGKIRQAKKILETPGLRARHQRLEQRCRRLMEEDRAAELEHLVNITKDVFDVDRNMMFMYLFETYKRQQDCDKAVGIWTTMQEENIEPSETFLYELGQFLIKNGRDVPFVMPMPPSRPPVVPQNVNAPPKTVQTPSAQMEATPMPKALFSKALKEKNINSAIQSKKEVEESGGRLSVTEESKLLELFVQESKLEEAAKLAREMIVTGQYPLPRVFKFLLNQLAKAGNVEAIEFFDKYIDENLKRTLSYNNRLCNAYLAAGRAEEFLDELSSIVESSRSVEDIRGKFPAGGIMGILQRQKDLMPKVVSIAEKCASKGINVPANCVWMHHFTEGAHAEAKEIYDKCLLNSSDNLLFGHICQKARESATVDLLPPLVEILNSRATTSESAKGIAYSCWLDVLCANQRYEEALTVLEGSLKEVTLQHINNTALVRVKEGLASSNKTFPYTIPKKVRRDQQSSSSSSSDSN